MVEGLALVQHAFATVAGHIDQYRAPDYATFGDRQDTGLVHAADGAHGVIAVPQFVVVPYMAEGVVLGRTLQVHEDHIVGVLHMAVDVCLPSQEVALVQHVGPHRRAPTGPQGFALGMADLHLQGEGLALAHAGDAAQDLCALQVVEGADFIVRPPFAPIAG
ncbi:hypothetical protein D9M71_674810 [compost metagenome]